MRWKIRARNISDGTVSEVDPREVKDHPDLTPNHDEQMVVLMEKTVKGELPLYWGAVPLGLVVPFDLDYRPDLHPVGRQMIDMAFQEGAAGKMHNIIVYQRGCWFVSSDDYPYLFAAIRGLPDYVPCWILGKPDSEYVKDLQGPISVSEVPKVFGLV